jgi:hypothetical protein
MKAKLAEYRKSLHKRVIVSNNDPHVEYVSDEENADKEPLADVEDLGDGNGVCVCVCVFDSCCCYSFIQCY